MGLYDRDYTHENSHHRFGGPPQMRLSLPKLTPVVKRLLIINLAVFAATFLIRPLAQFFFTWFSVHPVTVATTLQLWRPITYQFLHSVDGFGHVFVNMLWLFFFGPMLERLWGSKKFLIFYLICGAAGGVVYPLLVHAGWLDVGQLVGASGAILGIVAAAAILFPRQSVYVWGILPVPLVVIAIVAAFTSLLTILRPHQFANAGGEAAHLAGMVAGAIYVFSQSYRIQWKSKFRSSLSQKKVADTRDLQLQIDRILQKVHDSGIHSLTAKEKRTLKLATKAQQTRTKL